MKSAQEGTTEIITSSDDERRHMSAQPHLILLGVLRDEPLNIVMNALDCRGFEAWRRLTKHHELATASRIRGLLWELLNPTPTNDGFMQSVEKWETHVAKYESQSKDVVGYHIRIGIVTDLAPPELQTHHQLNAGQLVTCFEVRKIVVEI